MRRLADNWAIRLKNDLEQITDEWNGSRESFDAYIHQHASTGDPRPSKLDGANHDKKRDQRVQSVADAWNQPDDSSDSKPEASRSTSRGEILNCAGTKSIGTRT